VAETLRKTLSPFSLALGYVDVKDTSEPNSCYLVNLLRILPNIVVHYSMFTPWICV
jgi:hypothetical protein